MIKQLLNFKSTILILLVLEFIIAFAIYMNTQYKIDTFINNKTKSAEVEYKAVYAKIKEQSQMIFQENINIPIVINSFKNAYTSNKQDQDIIRKKLYNDLLPSYSRLNKLIHLRIIQFVFPDNRSFLRVHKPNKFGDDLTGVRTTIEYVNKYKKPIDGFEEGRIYNGFRFVYPLLDEANKYLGSIDISFSIESFNNVLNNELHSSKLIILKSIVDKKVWKENTAINYKESLISPLFLVDKTQFNNKDRKEMGKFKQIITPQLKFAFSKNILNEHSFSLPLPSKNKTYLLTFLPIKNPVSDKVVSYIVLISQDNILNDINTEFWIFQSFSLISILIIFSFLYRDQQNRNLLIKSESKYKNVIENIKDHYFFYSHDKNGIFTYLSDSITNILSYTKKEFMEHYSTYLTNDPINNLAEETTNKTINGEQQEPYVLSIYHKNGTTKYLEISESRLNDSNGEFISVNGVARDVTHSYLISQELEEKNINLEKSYDLLNKLAINVPGALYQYRLYPDGRATFPYSSIGIKDIYEVSPKDIIDDAQAVFDILHPDDLEMLVQSIQDSARTMQDWILEYRVKLPKKGVRWLIGHAKPEELKDGSILWHGFINDITKRKKIEAELREQKDMLHHLAHHDALTKLPNRVLFYDRLKQAIEKAKRNKTNIALLFIDLDHFKEINDYLGHDVGDEILKAVSTRLQEVVRDGDTVARLGGDEFTMILEELSQAQDASLIANKILENLSKEIIVNDNTLNISSSIGISIYPDDAKSTKELLKFADSAMYRAKEKGRNNYQYYK